MKYVFIFYGIFVILIILLSYLFVDENLFYLHFLRTGFATNNRIVSTVSFSIIIFVAFVLYFFLLRNIEKFTIKTVKIFLLISSTLVIAYPAIVSFDIFNYITTAKVLFFYHENPYIIMPIELTGEPYLQFTRAANKLALYGPNWIVLSGLPYLLGFNNFLLTLFNFKIFVAIFYFGIVYLLSKKTDVLALGIFAFNPLVLFETFISGHNDVVMMFLALLSFYFVRKNKLVFGFMFLILSILIKYATVVLLPVYIYFLWKKTNREKIDWDKVYLWSWILMFFMFFFSFIREEIYPWYAVWFLTFTPFLVKKPFIVLFSIVASFSLLFRYLPFMATGNYFGTTPVIRESITIVPIALFLFIYPFTQKWLKKIFVLS